MMKDEIQRIKDAYKKKKDKTNIAYSCLFSQQRENEIKEAIRKNGFISLCDKRILDIGCGNGAVLSYFLKERASPENLYGIDLLSERIDEAKKIYPYLHFICGNAEEIPYADDYFDIITQSTVFTSILDPKMKKRIASEMLRVLKPNGVIIWHDYRFNNPFNPNAKGIRKKEIINLFPHCQFDFKLINLNPFIGRLLAKFSWRLCETLEKITVLRTHWLVVIKQEDTLTSEREQSPLENSACGRISK